MAKQLHAIFLGAFLVFTSCQCGTNPGKIDGGSAGGSSGGIASSGGGDATAGGNAQTGGSTQTGGGSASVGGGTAAGGSSGGSVDSGIPVNPNDPGNQLKDSDCDGLNDAEEFGNIYPGGQRTDPGNPDSDGDGIKDGVEAGRISSVDATCQFSGDSDPNTRTNPTAVDSDGDGIADGVEDTNKNGRAEPTETDALNPDSDFDNLSDGAEDTNKNGMVDTGETNPRKKDTDGDFINDGIEKSVTMTDPLKADTDNDTCLDGAEDANQNGIKDMGETDPKVGTDCGPGNNPDSDMDGLTNLMEDRNMNGMVDANETNPNNPDTDGDGLKDGVEDANKNGLFDPGETNALRKDTDCDGLLDGPDAAPLKGEDQNANGTVDMGETDPKRKDTDLDGISDGVERGVTAALLPDMANCGSIPVDLDGTTTTNPNSRDTDGDGIDDGAEDVNQNGRVDMGELNPNNANDGTGPAGKVCTAMNLRPVTFKADGAPDVQLGIPATLTEINTMTVGGSKKGFIGYDPMNQVAFVAWRQAAPAGATNVTQDEVALKASLQAIGAITNDTTQNFTSWDSIPSLQAFYDQAGGGDLKARANAIATSLVGAGAGTLTGTAVNGPFKLQMQILHRTNTSVVVVIALTPLASFTGNAPFVMSDTAGGSAVAQFGDANANQCELFTPRAGKVDFLFVVDDSCSMAASQGNLSTAANAMAAALNNSTIDYRLALVTSSYHISGTGTNRGVLRGFTQSLPTFQAWLTQGMTGWITTGGAGSEGLLGGARKAVDDLTVLPLPAIDQMNRVRVGAQLVVVLLGDADDQTTGYSTVLSTATPNLENVQNFIDFFNNSGTGTKNRLATSIKVHGIVCPVGIDCNGEFQETPQRHARVITATGGIRGAINDGVTIAASMTNIVNSAIAAAGYVMQKPPIGASVKVAMSDVQTAAMCNKDDIPRSKVNGFDFDGINRSISFFGACRPLNAAVNAAVSYRYWVDTTPNPGGNPPPCSADSFYDVNEADFCRGRLACNLALNICECPQDCGGGAPPGKVCNTNRFVCDFVCTSDCGGTCSNFEQCNVAACGCECKQAASCPTGYRFQNGAGVCGCVCDTAALNCGATYAADPASCSCVCKPNCGGCGANEVCNSSTCQCVGSIN
jgi:hypothetical protein